MRVWIDITNSPHVLVFRPLIALLRERGADVEVTSRDYAQTVQLLKLHGIDAEILGAHGGRGRLGKTEAMFSRLRALHSWARGRRFDVAPERVEPGRVRVDVPVRGRVEGGRHQRAGQYRQRRAGLPLLEQPGSRQHDRVQQRQRRRGVEQRLGGRQPDPVELSGTGSFRLFTIVGAEHFRNSC